MIEIKEGLLLWFINFLLKSQNGVVLLLTIIIMRLNKISVPWTWLRYNKLKNYTNQELEKNLKKKVDSEFRDNTWGADLGDMQLINKSNKGFRFLLCVIDIYSKYAWVIPLKDKKGASIVDAFQKILDISER